ncbi:hypothetical protein BDN70DRAFT_901201 [Pholiota conissans]|uniref:Uncharacterized protein n=1 Tax=Pholiota conissans TaxID=109636 RepID=A0A9P5YN19_9AGAR|nr:hypothetical protein BDN70DRAFT_901201 [Pholiota conissans]
MRIALCAVRIHWLIKPTHAFNGYEDVNGGGVISTTQSTLPIHRSNCTIQAAHSVHRLTSPLRVRKHEWDNGDRGLFISSRVIRSLTNSITQVWGQGKIHEQLQYLSARNQSSTHLEWASAFLMLQGIQSVNTQQSCFLKEEKKKTASRPLSTLSDISPKRGVSNSMRSTLLSRFRGALLYVLAVICIAVLRRGCAMRLIRKIFTSGRFTKSPLGALESRSFGLRTILALCILLTTTLPQFILMKEALILFTNEDPTSIRYTLSICAQVNQQSVRSTDPAQ